VGKRVWVKRHLKTKQGIKNLSAAEAERLAGSDPDHAQRDLYNCGPRACESLGDRKGDLRLQRNGGDASKIVTIKSNMGKIMNGAQAVLKTLADNGVEACFSNPGTSEMQLVAAFDLEPRVKPILCLFEGVATGAADGYARVAGKPAATLLHLGAGLSNGSANLHNARRAGSPIVNLIGDHATYHRALDAPLTSDIAALAKPVSVWVRSAETAQDAVSLSSEAVRASQTARGPATLILPADCMWSESSGPAHALGRSARTRPDPARIAAIAQALKSAKKPVLLLGSGALTEQGLVAAGRIALRGVPIFMDTFVARQPRGAGRFAPQRMQYFGEMALANLQGIDLMILVSTKPPVAFFAYPGVPSVLVPEGCSVETLSRPEEDGEFALQALADSLAAAPEPATVPLKLNESAPVGALTPTTVGVSVARHLPNNAIVSEDAVTAGLAVYAQTYTARPHDWLFLTGGSIGQGIPVAIGAAIAKPQCKVVCLTGDGAAAYTLQALWTLVREELDVTVVLFANRAYRILDMELARTLSGVAGNRARSLLSLTNPTMDWVSIASGFGVRSTRCESAESFDSAFASSMAEEGPSFIEAVI
jgi:acetolactate synthase-1/2/3 large subunit